LVTNQLVATVVNCIINTVRYVYGGANEELFVTYYITNQFSYNQASSQNLATCAMSPVYHALSF